jgi:hypothetical protein
VRQNLLAARPDYISWIPWRVQANWPGPPLRRRRIDPRGLQKVTARGKEYQAWPQAQVTEGERFVLTCHAD